MAFKLRSGPGTFKWPVEFYVPEDGKHVKKTINVEFLRLSSAELKEAGASLQGDDQLSAVISFAKKTVSKFHDLHDENGQPVSVEDGVDALVEQYPQVLAAIAQAYTQALSGPESPKEAARKN